MVILRPVGDVELWYAQADDMSWRLPLHVEWKMTPEGHTYGLVVPGVCFYQIQLLAVQAILGAHSMEKRKDRWLVQKPLINALLIKAPGIHAEFYYHWPGGTHPPIPSPYHPVAMPQLEQKPDPRRTKEYEPFGQYISKECGIPADVVVIVMTAIRSVGARWLLEHRQALDLGWVRLIALPFRANWKDIVLFKTKSWKMRSIFKQTKRIRNAILHKLGFERTICSLHNVALCTQRANAANRVGYTVEAVTSDAFEKTADTVENHRMMDAGRSGYVTHFEEAVEHFYDDILEALAGYLQKIHTAWGSVSAGSGTGVLSFVPVGRRRYKVRGIPLCDIPAHIVPPSSFSVLAENSASDPALVQEQTAAMQKMSDLLQTSENLRQCTEQGDVAESRPEGSDRVPLLDGGESAAAGEPMLPCD